MNQVSAPGRFTKCPAHMPRETAQSYLGRLTTFFGTRNPREFCGDFGLNLRGIMHGDDGALNQLANITGASAEALVRWSPKRINEKYMSLNGQILHTRDNPRHEIRICPVCAQEDIAKSPGLPWDQAVYGRAEWMLAVVDCCVQHHVRLISRRGPKLDAVRIDAGYEATMLLEDLQRDHPEAAMLDDFQLYVLGRIGVIPPTASHVLDGLSLLSACQVCHAAGLDVMSASLDKSKVTENTRRLLGFQFFGRGRAELERNFRKLRHGCKVGVGATTLIPRLMEYLYQGRSDQTEFEAFIDTLLDVVFRHLPYAEGETIMGRKCRRRWLHDFKTAQAAYGVLAHQLAAFLDGTPELAVQPFGRPDDALIDVEAADHLFFSKTPFLSTSEVGRKLGRRGSLIWQDLASMKVAGLLHEATGAKVSPRNSFYSEPEIDALIQSLVGEHEKVEADDPTLVSIYDLSFRFGMNNQTFWNLVAAGRLTRLRLAKDAGFIDGIRADLREVMRVICGLDNAMTRPEVCELLQVDVNIVRILEANAVLRSVSADPRYSNKLCRLFDGTEVNAFRQEYMPLPEVRQCFPERPSFQRLMKMGLHPAIRLEPAGKAPGYATFYSRADVLRLS